MTAHKTGRIAFQGEPGAYSHQACREARPDLEALPCRTFEDAIEAVRKGEADLAMLPVENSTYGRVADIHHLLPESGLHIVGEAVASGWPIETLVYAPERMTSIFGQQTVEAHLANGGQVLEVSAAVFDNLSEKDGPQGLAAVARQRWVDLEDIHPQTGDFYKEIIRAGVHGMTIYQETYDQETYRRLHPTPPIRDHFQLLDLNGSSSSTDCYCCFDCRKCKSIVNFFATSG
ncbi:hypothetical protein EOM89_04270 [Candidatus Falkowbacteria bacterium]|nr:hypothetical protein [Candidatus Falkowbacteria bacterium]